MSEFSLKKVSQDTPIFFIQRFCQSRHSFLKCYFLLCTLARLSFYIALQTENVPGQILIVQNLSRITKNADSVTDLQMALAEVYEMILDGGM